MPEWKELVQAVGEFEAMKDWMQFEDVRTVSEVMSKLNPQREVEIFSKTDSEDNKLMTREFAQDMMDFLEKKVGIKGQIINDPNQRWKGKLERVKEDGKVRYIPTINLAYAEISDGFHEYAHVFLAALRKSNPALFNSLYNELTNSPEWKEIKSRAVTKVKSMYPELTGNIKIEDYKEEVLATAIGYASELNIEGKQNKISTNLRRVLDRVFQWLNSFFTEIFSYKLATNKINENTSLAQVIDWMTDTRTKFILDENWNDVYETEIDFENAGGINVQEAVSPEQEIETNLTADLETAIAENPKLDMDAYISSWLDKTFKLPKKAYAPRKIPKSVIVENTAKSLLKKIGNTFEMYGLELKKDPSQNTEIVNKLINVLTPIEFTYKFANYLDKKTNTSISLSQPFAVVKTTMIKDKTGVERKQTTINLPITENEAVVVNEFQKYLKDKNPGKKSMLADEIKAEYLAWADENYGISWASAKGHDFYGFDRAINNYKVKNRTYRRITFADEFYSTSGHQLNVADTGVIGPGIGWYVNSTINDERYDHEFQSDILPEIRKSYEKGGYSSFKEEYIELSDAQKKERIKDLARIKIYEFIRKSNDRLFASSPYLIELIREKRVALAPGLYDNDELPFSKIENYNINELRDAQKLLLSELDVRIDTLISYRMGSLQNLANIKADLKMFQVLTGKKSELKEEVLKLFSTFRIEEQYMAGTPRNTIQTMDPDELPFSKLEGEKFLGISVKGNKSYKIYATEETYKNLPSFFQEFANQSNEWYNSNSRFKPSKEINAVDIINNINIPSYFSGDKLKSYPSLVKLRNARKASVDKAFNNYRGTKRTIKAYEFRKIVYQDTANILKIAEYFKGQYERYITFYEDIFQESMEYAKKKEKLTFDEHPEFKRYRRYNALFDKFFPILIAQSVNSAKMEGRDHYYLPTGKAMELIEGNPAAKNLYLTASETGEVISTVELGQRYISQNTQESADVIKRYVGDKLYTYTQETTPLDIAVDLAGTGFYESKEFNDFAREERSKITLKKGMMPGPFNVALTTFAKKNNIKLTEETPEWSNAPLIKVDISGYTVKPIERFSKLEPTNEDINYNVPQFGEEFGKYNGSFRKNVEGVKVLLGSGIVSLVKMPSQFQNVEGITKVTLPKVQTAVKGEVGSAEREIMVTNELAEQELDKFLTEFDIDFIEFKKTKDAIWVEIPTMAYEQAQLERRPSYKPSKKDRLAMMNEKAMDTPQPDNKGGSQLTMFYKEINETPSFTEIAEENNPQKEVMINQADVDNAIGFSHISQIAERLSEKLGVPYDFIDEQEAYNITQNSLNPYRGEPAFFYNGKVYFVKNKVRANMVFHEFAHPLVKALRLQNPALFNKIFNEFLNTPEAQDIIDVVNEFYGEDFATFPEEAKEEMLVRAIEKMAVMQDKSIRESTGFAKVMKDLMYFFKQMFRKLFGQNISIQTLSANTTLQDLANILTEGGQFVLEKDVVTQQDIVNYMKERTEYIEAFTEIANKDYDKVQSLIDINAKAILKHLNKLEDNQNLYEIAEVFKNEFSQSEFAKMKEQIGAYSNILNSKLANMKKNVQYNAAASSALTNTLFRLNVVLEKAYEHIKTLDPNDPDSLHKAYYYKELIGDYTEFIEDAQKLIIDNRDIVGRDHPIATIVNKIDNQLKDCSNEISKIDFEGMSGILTRQLEQTRQNIDQRYAQIQKHLEDTGADEKQKKYWKAEYEKVKLTPERIRETLKGNMGDANPFNSFLEGYMYNTDPVIGGFAAFVRDNITEVMIRAQTKHDTFIQKIMPLLQDWGKYNPKRQGELGTLTGFLDKVALRKTGEDGKEVMELFEVWSFLNEFKDFRYDRDLLKFQQDELEEIKNRDETDEARKAYIKKKYEFAKWKRDYMHQQFTPAYYKRLDLLEKDEVGQELGARMDEIFHQINLLYEPTTMQEDILGTLDKVAKYWRDYHRLASFTDIRGNLKTGMDYDVAVRMLEYKEASKGLYDFLPIDRAFEDAYEAYEQKLIDKYAKTYKGAENFKNSLEYQSYMTEYIKKNTRISILPEFWQDRQEILDNIRDLVGTGPDLALVEEMEELQNELRSMLIGYKDEDDQYIGSEMTPELIAKVKKIELDIAQIKEEIKERKKAMGMKLSRDEREQLQMYLEELDDIQIEEPTDYYIDAINDLIIGIDSPLLTKLLGTNAVDKDSVGMLLDKPVILRELMSKSPEFKDWFEKNHYISYRTEEKEYIDEDSGEIMSSYEKVGYYKRVKVWTSIRPRDSKYYDKFTFILSDGSEHTIDGKPSVRFFKRVVKDEFKTGYDFKTGQVNLIVGVHISNKGKHDYLPRLTDPVDNKYINDRYFQLKSAPKGSDDAKLFKVLEALKEYHLENQQGLERSKKLYMDYPRNRKNFLETLQTTDLFKKKWSAFGVMFRNIADFFRKAKDDPDSGLNPDDQWNMAKAEMFDDKAAQIPMTGLYGLDPELVSTNILDSLTRYMISGEKNKKLVELNPYAQALSSQLKLASLNKTNFKNRGLLTWFSRKGKNVREQAVNNFIEREFFGMNNKGILSGSAFAQKLSTMMFRNASFGFFTLNIPSDLKNAFGAKFQGLIHAASKEHYSLPAFLKAEAWSMNVMKEISFNVYNKGEKPLVLRVVDAFDPLEGRMAQKLGEGMSRTFLSDVAHMNFLMSFRKWTEMQASMQQFGAMLMSKQIEQDGKMISYADAWEVRNGLLQLKSGIDPKWGITYDDNNNPILGEEFVNFRNTVHSVMRDLNGAYDSFNQPEAQRYLLFRYFSFLRRYFTTMLVNRYGFSGSLAAPLPRLNVGYGNVREGFYITTLKFLLRSMVNIHKTLPYALPHEKQALLKMATEIGALITINMLLAPLFGWDPDDEDRFEKLREKSGALPFLGMTAEDVDNPFSPTGFLSNHALNLMMQVRAENEQFLPLPGFGVDDFGSFLDIKSIAAGPTLKKYGQILNDLYYLADDDQRAYYQRDVGPYKWQQEESAKIWNHLLGTIGLTGSTTYPAVTIKNFQSIQSRQ